MNHCDIQPGKIQNSNEVLFEGVFDKPVKAAFDAPKLSSNGGALLIGGMERTLGLAKVLAGVLPDLRAPERVEHTVEKMVRQQLVSLCCGHEDFNDADKLRDDPVLKFVSAGSDGTLASSPTLCRLANSLEMSDHMAAGLAMARWMLGLQARRRDRVKCVTIDLDPTDIPTYGQQVFSFFNGYYDNHCLLPMLAFVTFHDSHGREEAEHWLAGALLRSGKAHATLGARWMLRKLVEILREFFPGVRIRVRLDGGYASPKIFDLLEQLGVTYVVGLPSNKVLEKLAEPLMAQTREKVAKTGMSARTYGDMVYKAGSWSKSRRVVAKAEVLNNANGEKDNLRFVVTNMSLTLEAQELYEGIYCKRGDIETRIKEVHEISMRTSCTAFAANQFRVHLAVGSYMLMQELRRRYCECSGTNDRPQVGRLREMLVKLAAVVKEVKRRLYVSLPECAPIQKLWCLIGKGICVQT